MCLMLMEGLGAIEGRLSRLLGWQWEKSRFTWPLKSLLFGKRACSSHFIMVEKTTAQRINSLDSLEEILLRQALRAIAQAM